MVRTRDGSTSTEEVEHVYTIKMKEKQTPKMVLPRWARAEHEVQRVFVKDLAGGAKKYLVAKQHKFVLKEDRHAEVGPRTAIQRSTPCPKRDFSLYFVTEDRWGNEIHTKEVP